MSHLEKTLAHFSARPIRSEIDSDTVRKNPYLAIFDQTVSRMELTEICRAQQRLTPFCGPPLFVNC